VKSSRYHEPARHLLGRILMAESHPLADRRQHSAFSKPLSENREQASRKKAANAGKQFADVG
jgi:hypothetical protein